MKAAPKDVFGTVLGKRKEAANGVLPKLPEGCRWGYCTPTKVFVPLDPIIKIPGESVTIVGEGTAGTLGKSPTTFLSICRRPILIALVSATCEPLLYPFCNSKYQSSLHVEDQEKTIPTTSEGGQVARGHSVAGYREFAVFL